MNSYTVENAPRTPAELAVIGRFNLRNIATALGLMSNEQAKASFMALSNEAMATQIAPMLADYDKAKGGGGKVQTKQAEPPRTPVTSQQAPASPQVHQNQAPAPNGAVGVVQLVQALEAMKLEYAEGSKGLQEKIGSVDARVEELTAILRGTNRILLTSMALNLFLAEEVLKSDRASIIKTAHDDVESLVATLTELDPGISDAASEEEEVGEEGEEGKA